MHDTEPITSIVLRRVNQETMAAGCCGTKKQKLNDSTSIPRNNTVSLQNGIRIRNSIIAQPEMGFYCFDVLYCQLHQLDPPKPPNFSNEALWVFVIDIISIQLLSCLLFLIVQSFMILNLKIRFFEYDIFDILFMFYLLIVSLHVFTFCVYSCIRRL